MSSTPYAPPVARVGDPVQPPRVKPDSVRRALACLWIAVAISILTTFGQLARISSTAEAVQVLLIGAFSAGLLALVAAKVDAGRGWARWVYVATFLLGSCFFVIALLVTPETFAAMPLVDRLTALVQFVLQTVALVLLFAPASRRWFSGGEVE